MARGNTSGTTGQLDISVKVLVVVTTTEGVAVLEQGNTLDKARVSSHHSSEAM